MNLACTNPVLTAQPVVGWLRALRASAARSPQPASCQRRSVHAVGKGEFLKVTRPHGITIESLEGEVWVTVDNDPRDVMLQAGHSFHVDSRQRVLVQALDAARVRLHEPA